MPDSEGAGSGLVKTDIEHKVAIARLDNPPVNLLSPDMVKALAAAVKTLLPKVEAGEVGALIVTGTGTHAFCAGADLKALGDLEPSKAADVVRMGHEVFGLLAEFPVPVVAAVNSLALGGGMELALACDLRISSDRARFGQPETWVGLIPAWGGSTRLTRLIGPARAKELIFTGAMVNAQEAQRIGLVNKIVPDGEEVRAAIDLCRAMIQKAAPLAIREAKKVINEGSQKASLQEAFRLEAEAAGRLAKTADLKEGIQAFVEKRPAQFQGK